jgi:hypothetical protein
MLTDEASLPRIDVNRREAPLPSDLRASYNEWRRHVSSRLENGEQSLYTAIAQYRGINTEPCTQYRRYLHHMTLACSAYITELTLCTAHTNYSICTTTINK